jgi:2-hydroxychromene-2-carboxylate isomerase
MTAMIDFWFSVGSTYSYLTVMRIDEVAKARGVAFRWRPFSVRVIMVEQNNIPFRGKPVKTAYMWRDIERRAARYGLPVKVPAPYPLPEFDFANLVATLAAEEGWLPPYARACYRRWMQDGEPAGSEPNLSASLAEVGQDPARVAEAARSGRVDAAYKSATDEARALGVFGSPTFSVDGELFWGDDRMDDAIEWRLSRQSASGRPCP